MKLLEFCELIKSKTNKSGYISVNDLNSLNFVCKMSLTYFKAHVTALIQTELLSEKLDIEGEKVYSFNQFQYEKLTGKKKEKKGDN